MATKKQKNEGLFLKSKIQKFSLVANFNFFFYQPAAGIGKASKADSPKI